jgi:hypothetical protein
MRRTPALLLLLLVVAFVATACDSSVDRQTERPEPDSMADAAPETAGEGACPDHDPNGMALFGDVHVHTSYSFDAAANSFGATPVDAHRYARGEPIDFFPLDEEGNPIGTVRIDRPLDFLAVTDHGEFLGERALCRTEGSPKYDTPFCTQYRSNQRIGMQMLAPSVATTTPARIAAVCGEDGSLCLEYARSPWESIQAAANDAYEPCHFTSFVAYEYTGVPHTSNYHRNVIFRGEAVPALPVSYIEAPLDSELWSELDLVCRHDAGCEYLTIPHNTNLANGRMAPYMGLEDTTGARRAYAEARLHREPIMEIFQHKGGSECINGLSTILGAPDELCDVEQVRRIGSQRTVQSATIEDGRVVRGEPTTLTTTECPAGEVGENGMVGQGCVDETDFHRSALLVGLKEEEAIGLNPIKLGVIASTDTHSATPGGVVESAWTGAVTGEATPAQRLQKGLLTSGIDGNPGGLAGVWATENTRDAIFDAMLRREVFGTSGPRIRIRLFAGWSLDEGLCDDPDMVATAYETGVPMGGDLEGSGHPGKPKLLAWAMQDPDGQKLQKLQLVKGWIDADGGMHAEVLPIAESEAGASTLCTVFTDETFDPARSAYYYARAVEPATPRWHTYDCARLDEAERPEVCTNGSYPETIHEMAWSSPIWYRPAP